MILTHAKQRIATRLLRQSPEMWVVTGDERRALEMQIASGEARSAWQWHTAENAWELVAWLPHAVPPALLRAQQARLAAYRAPAALPAAPEPRFAPAVRPVVDEAVALPYGLPVPVVRKAAARPIAMRTHAPFAHEPARWLE